MCDYSLACVPNRLAIEGEELVVHRFYTGTRGLTSPQAIDPEPPGFWNWLTQVFTPASTPAVCIPPGAVLHLADIAPEVQHSCSVGEEAEVRFVQRSCNEFEHRDAIRFPSGRVLPLQFLREGQRVRVLNLDEIEEPVRMPERDARALVQDFSPA